ncbi:MAG: hypothetical protein ABI068_02130, partial [Ktedonobacterales bacterium]
LDETADAPGNTPDVNDGAPVQPAFQHTYARLASRVALGLFVVAALYRLYLIARGWPLVDSDEAIVGLMGRHILRGEFPVFLWGQSYMGALQSYLAAPLFALFGSSDFTLHIAELLITMGFIAAMYALGRAVYGQIVGLLTLAWLMMGPPIATLRELTPAGGYQEMLLFTALLLLGLWARLRQPQALPRTRQEWRRCIAVYAGMGLMAGGALWADILVAPALLLVTVALLARRTREVFTVAGLALVLFFLIGAAPAIFYNIQYPNATYKQVSAQNRRPGQTGPLPTFDQWRMQAGETLDVAFPTILGSPYVCVKVGAVWFNYPPAEATSTTDAGGVCDLSNMGFSLAALAVLGIALWQPLLALLAWARAIRGYRWLKAGRQLRRLAKDAASPATVRDQAQSDRVARYWISVVLVGIVVANLSVYSLSVDAQRYQFTSVRYLLLAYLSAPVLFYTLWRPASLLLLPLLRPTTMRLTRLFFRDRKAPSATAIPASIRKRLRERFASRWAFARSLVAGLALVTLLLFGLIGVWFTLAHANNTAAYGQPNPPVDQQLIAFLHQQHITAFYGDYWVCDRLVFETREQVICASRGGDKPTLALNTNRYTPYVAALAKTPYPAYILPLHSQQDRAFAADAAALGLPYQGYQRVVIGSYAVYYHAP